MTFKDMRFPVGISIGAVGGPRFSTDVVTLNSGFESRNQNWSASRCEYDVSKGCTTLTDRDELIGFFRICKGKVHTFRFQDPADYQVSSAQGVLRMLTIDTYQLVKRYTTEDGDDDRDIALPYNVIVEEAGSPITVLVLGVDYTIDLLTGVITLLGSPLPAPTSWSGKFDIPARFDMDRLQMTAEERGYFKTNSISIVEVRYPES